ncbi:UNVERIFIED_CONTAM: Transcription factor [Sesamum latifolium]|uniref:Transcription factor n=1 Tax=Sesamum latifolium TaxID=2727402 RepID=A0AAW2TSH8_9LAMI
MLPLGDQVGYYMQNPPMASVFNGFVPPGVKPLMPFSNVDIQPSDACPRNFIIFDQTNNRSQIMFHPEINSKFFCPPLGIDTSMLRDNVEQKDSNDERKVASSSKEDSDDIDALLSSEYEENEECDDDDEVSTARTGAVYECNSPDSCSNYESPSKKSRPFLRKSSGGRGSEKKRQRMRKMVKALRGIVPGANRMSTVAVLDEAVRYLKSLRVEVKKLGVGNSKG